MKKPVQARNFRPYVETLECRAQPGSILGLGGSLLASSALDLNAGTDLGAQTIDQQLVAHRRLDDSDLTLTVRSTGREAASSRETAPTPVMTAATSAPVQSGSQNGLSIQDQTRAVTAHTVQTAAATHQAYTLSGAPVTAHTQPPVQGQGHTLNQSQTAGQYQATSAALAAESVSTPQAAVVSHAAQVQALNLKVTAVSNNHVPPPVVTNLYISYLIGLNPDGTAAGPSSLNGVRANPAGDGSAYAVGTATDPNTGLQDAVGIFINPDGSLGSALIFADPNGVNSVVANSVDIGQDGSIYVVGSFGSTDFIARIESDMATLDWAVSLSLTGGAGPDTFTSARDAVDPNVGEALYVTGTFADPNTGNADLAVLEISNLQSDPSQLQLAGGGFALNDPNGNPANTLGTGISVDANGQAYVSGKYGLTDNSDSTALVLASPSGITTGAFVYLTFSTDTATNGAYNSVDVDPNSGVAYLAGTLGTTLGGTANAHQALVISAFTIDVPNLTVTSYYTNMGQQIGGWLWSLTNGQYDVDWYGTGNKVIPGTFTGSQSDQAINSFANDPNNPGGGLILWRVGPNGDMSLDSGLLFNPPGGSLDDRSTALDIQPDPFGGNDYYQVGFTNSPDFLTTSNAFQQNDPDPSGSTYQGWVSDTEITPA